MVQPQPECQFDVDSQCLTSTSWVIAVSSDDGENDGWGVQHTQHIHNERGMGWRRERVARMRGGHDGGD